MQQVCRISNGHLQRVCYIPGTVLVTEDIIVKNKKSFCCHKFVSYKAKVLLSGKDV